MRLREWFGSVLQAATRQERHRRRAERDRLAPPPPLTAAEAAEVFEAGQFVQAIKTGELPIVVLDPERPGIFVYPEPIGPQPPTVDDRWRLFNAEPLTAELPGDPAKDSPFYRHVLDEHAPSLDPVVLANLEDKTGYWRVEDFAALRPGGGAE